MIDCEWCIAYHVFGSVSQAKAKKMHSFATVRKKENNRI